MTLLIEAKKRLYTFLRWSEKFTKTDMVYLASGGSWILLGYAVQIISGVGLAIAFANLIPKEVFGTYQFLLSGAAIVSVFTLTGMGGAIARSAAQGSNGALRYGFHVQMVWNSGIVLAAAAASLYYFANDNSLLGIGFLVAGALQPFIVGFGLYKSYLQGKQRFKENVVLDIIQRLVSFTSILIALFLSGDPLILVSAYLLANAVALCLGYLFVMRRYPTPLVPDAGLKNYGKHLSLMESFAELASAVDKVLVWVFLGAAPLAAYVIAQMPVQHLQNIFGFLRILVFPKLAQRNFDDLTRILPQKIRLYFLVALGVVGAYVLAAPFLFGLIFPLYPESVLYSQLLALSILAIPRTLVLQTFLAHERKRELYIVNVSVPLVRMTLLALLLWQFGILGAIAAILATELYGAVLQWILFRRMRATLP